jgi:hypothetical protein
LLKNLKRNGFKDITFAADAVIDGHPIIPLGIRSQTFKKKRVAQILLDCCNKPVIVIVAPKDLPIDAKPLRFSNDEKGTMKVKEIGGYKVIAGAQDHTPDKVLKLFASVSTAAANVR